MKNLFIELSTRTMVAALVAIGWYASVGVVQAGVSYVDPSWDYIYNANAGEDAFGIQTFPPQYDQALDGQWLWESGNANWWDGSAPGDVVGPPGNAPGGVVGLSSGGTSFLRMQDTGMPRASQPPDFPGLQWQNPNNKRFLFAHDMDDSQPGAYDPGTVLDDGITLSFRARIPTTSDGTLDDQYLDWSGNDVGDGVVPWPTDGAGYAISGEGRGMFGAVQGDATHVTESQISFSLIKKTDLDTLYGAYGAGATNPFASGGLTMNALNGTSVTGTVDTKDIVDGTLPQSAMNIADISDADLNNWNEFWVTIKAATGGVGTHQVDVYMNGSVTPETFFVTAGGPHGQILWQTGAYLQMGLSWSESLGSVDVDFFSYKLGVIAPVAAALDDPDFNNDNIVDGADFLIWQRGAGAAGGNTQGDANNDGVVNAADLAIWQGQFGNAFPLQASVSAVPEPTSLVLAVFLGIFALGSDTVRRRSTLR